MALKGFNSDLASERQNVKPNIHRESHNTDQNKCLFKRNPPISQYHGEKNVSMSSWTCDGLKRQAFRVASIVFQPQSSRAVGSGNYRCHQPVA